MKDILIEAATLSCPIRFEHRINFARSDADVVFDKLQVQNKPLLGSIDFSCSHVLFCTFFISHSNKTVNTIAYEILGLFMES